MRSSKLCIVFSLLMTASCSNQNSDSDNQVDVYDNRFLINCGFSGNLTLEESSNSLKALGVVPLSSSCATLTNISITESCADLTGEFYVHKIESESLSNLSNSSFIETSNLHEQEFSGSYIIGGGGVGYDIVDCSN